VLQVFVPLNSAELQFILGENLPKIYAGTANSALW